MSDFCLLSVTNLSSTKVLTFAAIEAISGFQSRPAALYWCVAVILISVFCWIGFQGRRWRSFMGWVALAAAGQACSLQLLWVGPQIRLQLFYGWQALLKTWQGIFLIALLLQVVIVLWGLHSYFHKLKLIWQKRAFGLQAAFVLIALEAYAAITFEPEFAQTFVNGGFAHQAFIQMTKIALGLGILGVGAANLALAVAAIPSDLWDNVVGWWKRADRRSLSWLCAAWVVVVSATLGWFVLDRMPHVPDEVAYIIEAKYLATGHLTVPAPPDAKAFDYPFAMYDRGRWYGSAPAGWPFALALGYLIGAPWLVNPVLGGIAILLAHRWVKLMYDRDVADGTIGLLSFSPWLLFVSASLMPHALSLVLSLLGLLAVTHARQSGSMFWGSVAGLSFGALLHVRALEAAVVALVAGIWWLGVGWRRLRIPALICTCAFGLAMTGLYLSYNRVLTGDRFYVPINKYDDQLLYKGANRLGFGKDVGNFGWTGLDALPGHGPIDVVMNTNQNIYLVDFEMFGWTCGSLLFVFLLVAWREFRGDALMWCLLLSIWAGMSLYWFSGGPDFGARYWYQMIVPLAVLTVRGGQILQQRFAKTGIMNADNRVWTLIVLASLLGFVNVMPWRSLDKYHDYRGIRPDVRKLQSEFNFGRSLVFIRGESWPDYAAAAVLNPPTVEPTQPATIYARDTGAESEERIRSFYADRQVWVIAGPSVTGNDFRVVQGPLPAAREMGISINSRY